MTTETKTPTKIAHPQGGLAEPCTFVVSPPAPIESVCPDAETATAINHLILAWFAEQIAAEIKRRRETCYNSSKGENNNGV